MAKPTIKFSAVPYELNGHTGYRPQLESQGGIFDLDFCNEVVTEKRLAMSADELLHAVEMLAEVAAAKVAEDGRPRGVTKLLKWNRFASGNLESPTSAWNESCKAVIRPQLLADAVKTIDATFQNVLEGVGVKVDNVTWIGAQSVTNVIKVGYSFAAYGRHMEWLQGDTATVTVGLTAYPLTCTESDVAHAVFSWPAGLAPESGTVAVFVMKSRGGVEEGEVYTSRKEVTIINDTPVTPTLTKLKQGERADNTFKFDDGIVKVSHENYTHAEGDAILLRIYKDGALYYTYDITDQVGTWGEDAMSFPTIENNSEKSDNEFITNTNDIALVRGTSVYPLTVSVVAS